MRNVHKNLPIWLLRTYFQVQNFTTSIKLRKKVKSPTLRPTHQIVFLEGVLRGERLLELLHRVDPVVLIGVRRGRCDVVVFDSRRQLDNAVQMKALELLQSRTDRWIRKFGFDIGLIQCECPYPTTRMNFK